MEFHSLLIDLYYKKLLLTYIKFHQYKFSGNLCSFLLYYYSHKSFILSWPAKPKLFTIWTFIEKVFQLLVYSNMYWMIHVLSNFQEESEKYELTLIVNLYLRWQNRYSEYFPCFKTETRFHETIAAFSLILNSYWALTLCYIYAALQGYESENKISVRP